MEIVGDGLIDGNATVSTLTANSFVYTGTGGELQTTAAPTNGQLVIGSTGAVPVLASLTGGTGVSVTNGAGSITIANTGVTSIAGTANQIDITASTGAVTLSLDSALIAPGTIQSTGNITVGGTNSTLVFTSVTTTPANPAAGTPILYTESIAGYELPVFDNSTNAAVPLQPNIGYKRVCMYGPNTTTSVSYLNTVGATGGTVANPTPASTNLLTSVRQVTFASTATAGTLAYIRSDVLECWRGNAAGRGGFYFVAVVGLLALVTGMRCFIGLTSSIAAPTNVNPLTSTTNSVLGIAIAADTGDWSFVACNGTNITATSLGANIPVNNTDLIEVIIYSPPNGSSISYQITDLSTGNVASGTTSTDIPATTTFLGMTGWICNNTTATITQFAMARMYLETDY